MGYTGNFGVLDFLDNLAFTISPLFYKLLEMSLIASAIGIVIFLALKILGKRISPHFKYLIWAVMIIALILPYRPTSAVSITAPIDEINWMQHRDDYEELLNYTAPGAPPLTYEQELEIASLDNSISIRKLIFETILPLLWLFGMVVFLVVLLISKLRLDSMIYKSDRFPVGEEAVERCKKQFSIDRQIDIVISDKVSAPAVAGVFSPTILMPRYAEELDRQSLDYIIMHEISHCKRGDMVVNYLFSILQSVYWFNPIVALCFKFIRADLETSNDASVVKKLESDEQIGYAKSLVLILGKSGKISGVHTKLSMVNDTKNVENRIVMIKMRDYFAKNKLIISATTALVVVVIAVFMLTGSAPAPQLIEAETTFIRPSDGGEITINANFQTDWSFRSDNPEGDIFVAGQFGEIRYIYEGETAIGFIGFSQFGPYIGEVEREQYYQTVYPALRLARFFNWDPYTAVVSTETTEAAVAEVSYLAPEVAEEYMGELASAPYERYNGVLYYDTELESYFGMAFDPEMVDEEETIRIAESISLDFILTDEVVYERVLMHKYSTYPFNGYDIGEGAVQITDENDVEIATIFPTETIIDKTVLEQGGFYAKDYTVLSEDTFLIVNSNELGFFYTVYDATESKAIYDIEGIEDSNSMLYGGQFYRMLNDGVIIADIFVREDQKPAYYLYHDGTEVRAQEFPAEYGYCHDMRTFSEAQNGYRYLAFVNKSTELIDIYRREQSGLILTDSVEYDKSRLEGGSYLGLAYGVDNEGNLFEVEDTAGNF